jgi:hypothetical protein
MTTFRFDYATTAISLERPNSVAEMNLYSGPIPFQDQMAVQSPMFPTHSKGWNGAFAFANGLCRTQAAT